MQSTLSVLAGCELRQARPRLDPDAACLIIEVQSVRPSVRTAVSSSTNAALLLDEDLHELQTPKKYRWPQCGR